jgi:hypothetical protein
MFGLPAAKLRWTIARPTGSRNGIEIIEITQAGGRVLNRRIQDPGAVTLSRWVDELDPVLVRLKALGAVVVTKGGAPVATGDGGPIQGTIRQVVVRAPDGHFVHLSTRGPRTTAADEARLRLDGRVRLTVSNTIAPLRYIKTRSDCAYLLQVMEGVERACSASTTTAANCASSLLTCLARRWSSS